MRWFTREWQNGHLSEDEADARDANYAAYVASVADRLSTSLLAFAAPVDERFSVHDAKLDRAEFDLDHRRITMRLLNGDLQVGYGMLDLGFVEAELVEPSVHRVRAILTNPRTEFLRQEVEIVGNDPTFEVRFLLWPDGQIAIRSNDVTIARHPIADRTRSAYRSQVVVHPSSGE